MSLSLKSHSGTKSCGFYFLNREFRNSQIFPHFLISSAVTLFQDTTTRHREFSNGIQTGLPECTLAPPSMNPSFCRQCVLSNADLITLFSCLRVFNGLGEWFGLSLFSLSLRATHRINHSLTQTFFHSQCARLSPISGIIPIWFPTFL